MLLLPVLQYAYQPTLKTRVSGVGQWPTLKISPSCNAEYTVSINLWEQLFHQITGNCILGVPIESQPCKGGDLICERIIVGESLSSLYSLTPHPPALLVLQQHWELLWRHYQRKICRTLFPFLLFSQTFGHSCPRILLEQFTFWNLAACT